MHTKPIRKRPPPPFLHILLLITLTLAFSALPGQTSETTELLRRAHYTSHLAAANGLRLRQISRKIAQCSLGYTSRFFVHLPCLGSLALQSVKYNVPSLVKPDLKLLDRVSDTINRNYLDPDRIAPRKMLMEALDQVQKNIPEVLIKGDSDKSISVTVGLAARQFDTKQVNTLVDLRLAIHNIFPFIVAHYRGDTPINEIEYATINGMLESLDPHSNFLPPKVYNEFKVGTQGKFGGLGIVISIKDGMLTVIAPLEGTPASQAGILTGDHILQIDDESTINMSLTDAVNKLRGDVGTKVNVVIERTGKPPRKITLTRAIINIESVRHLMLSGEGKKIGYLQVKNFQANTDEDIKSALADFHRDGSTIDGLILDMRNNPGGLLNIAVDLADHFISKGTIVSTVGAHDRLLDANAALEANTEPPYPIVVLTNEGSASASEIVAGALQEHDRAIVLGRRSFGKGSVQTIFELGEDSALKLTIAQYKPGGTKTIQLVGVTPDIELVPVTVDSEDMNLIADSRPSEKDLEEEDAVGAPIDTGPTEQPRERIRYLKPKEGEKEAEETTLREYAKKPRIEGDFAINLAQKLLIHGGASSRSAWLAKIKEPLKTAGAEQEALINEALKKLLINWADAPKQGSPTLKLTYLLRAGKNTIKKVKAGQKVNLELTATNSGSGAYSQLIAVGESKIPFLADREFPFGRINPGESKRWVTQIEIPESLPTEDLKMKVTFKEQNGQVPDSVDILIPVEETPPPSFAFSYIPQIAKGRPLANGATIPFAVEIFNLGPGTSSTETFATLSNECGEKLFIERGRIKLQPFAPKTRQRADFRFHISPDHKKPDCAVSLAIADIKRRVFLDKKIKLDLEKNTFDPAPDKKYQPPTIEFAKFPSKTEESSIELRGEIHDTDPVQDYIVFVGEKKVAYIPNSQNTENVQFEFRAELEPGNNEILVAARDAQKLTARKMIVVERTATDTSKAK